MCWYSWDLSVDDGHQHEIDQERLIGIFSRSNLSTDRMSDEQVRKFYAYHHKNAVVTLRKAIRELKESSVEHVSRKRDGPIFKSDMYERLLDVYVWFITARWSLFFGT